MVLEPLLEFDLSCLRSERYLALVSRPILRRDVFNQAIMIGAGGLHVAAIVVVIFGKQSLSSEPLFTDCPIIKVLTLLPK